MLCLFATAQEVTDTMYIYQNDKIIERIPVFKIDSVIFVPAKTPVAPGIHVGDAVDLGLPSGVLWANCNVGASAPQDHGGYYAWGEIEEKDSYTEDNYLVAGKIVGDFSGDPAFDVARAEWGDDWRMPKDADFQELVENCTICWTILDGVQGFEFTGPNGNKIFLPAAGTRYDVYSPDYSYGDYWSSTYVAYESYASKLNLHDNSAGLVYDNSCIGRSVRPVSNTASVAHYTVSVSGEANGTVSIVGTDEASLTASVGNVFTFVATPNSGYKFVGWYVGDGETLVSTNPLYTFTVASDVSLVAKFALSQASATPVCESVDLGLPSGLLWATCNVGASSPEEYGGYYAWGETTEKGDYTKSTYNVSTKEKGYIAGNSTYDVARSKWGGDWHIPTKMDFQELAAFCTWNLTTLNGVNGYEVTGPNGNSIFLPATGSRVGTVLINEGYVGQYWCSTPYNTANAYGFDCTGDNFITGVNSCFRGRNVRPVCESNASTAVWSEWSEYASGTYYASDAYWSWKESSDCQVYYRESLVNDEDAQFFISYLTNGMDLTIDYNRKTGFCYVQPQQVTTNSNYGPVLVADYQNYPGNLPYSYEEFPCMFKADKGLFSLNIVYYVDPARGSNYEYVARFGNGKETIQLYGTPVLDYSFSMSFANQYVNENGENFAVISTIKGADISKYLITVVEKGTSIDEIVRSIIDETHSCYEFTESLEVNLPIENSGEYKVVAVTFDETGYICDVFSIDFNFYLNGNNPWESLGYATYVDDCVAPLFGMECYEYKVEVLENKDEPGLFRMVDPYGPEFPLYSYAASYTPGSYIEIDATDPDGVWIKDWQSTGLDLNYGIMSITSKAWYQSNIDGTTKDDVKEAGLCGVFADGVITFPIKGLAIAIDGGGYYCNNNGAFKLDLNNMTETLESSAARSARARIDKPTIKATGCLIEKSPKLIK